MLDHTSLKSSSKKQNKAKNTSSLFHNCLLYKFFSVVQSRFWFKDCPLMEVPKALRESSHILWSSGPLCLTAPVLPLWQFQADWEKAVEEFFLKVCP